MRILQVADFYWPYLGGVEQHVRTLGQGLAAAGHEVHVATLRVGDAPRQEHDGAVVVHRIPSTSSRLARLFASTERPWAPPLPDPEATLALRRLVADVRPHVVHGHDWLARSYLPLVRWARRRFDTRFVSTQHYFTLVCAKKDRIHRPVGGDSGSSCPGPSPIRCISCSSVHYGPIQGAVTVIGNQIGRQVETRSTDAMIAVSRATALGNGLDPSRTAIIANPVVVDRGVATDDPRPQSLPTDFILFVGDLRPMKGLDVLFAAHRLVRRRLGPTAPTLVVIGKRWPDTPTDVPDGVMVFERWPNDAVLAAWEGARLGVVPSVWDEPFGIVAVEALRGGTPVVASRVGGLPEIVRDGVDGLLVAPGDPVALAEALAELLLDEPRRATMSVAARERARDFDIGVVIPEIDALYRRTLS